ncbi:hydrogenase nickel incorporation protein HypB [Microbacterium schleiferi]|uniref:hydrogenase nickel incorporation protein HypB n=1 Tax=Microbacterium schleiferi TaxID=69362 RepID=UPI00311EAE95
MGRFHRHDDGTVHAHDHHDDGHTHEHSHEDHDHAHDHVHEDHIGDHSGYETGAERIDVLERIFSENDAAADRNRRALDAASVVSINLMSSPGAGKTTLLERTLAELEGRVRVGIVEGDIETALDADRLDGYGAQISLLNTGNGFGGECHLDAPMVDRALRGLELEDLDLVVIENVGNLVCPAEFDTGAHYRAMVASVTEGEDKPLKYPVMFRSVDVVVVNKTDLLPYLDFDLDLFLANVRAVNPTARIILTSAKAGDGLADWFSWIAEITAPATAAARG